MSKKNTIITYYESNGRASRWCMRCNMHVNENGEIDQDYYTARQYSKFLAIPFEDRCDHNRPDTKEELEKRVETVFAGSSDGQRALLREIIRRLP